MRDKPPPAPMLNLDRLFKLRLVVARMGEMDNARWWNTKGQLSRLGVMAVRRGFPRTFPFAQARSVFAVAGQRCAEVFDPPASATLWKLPAETEDVFEQRWHQWFEDCASWGPFFEKIAALKGENLVDALQSLGLVSDADLATYANLRRSAQGSAVALPNRYEPTDALITQLALGFARGEPGNPAVPYARLDG